MRRRETTLTQERLKELLHYDPETGLFTTRVKTAATIEAGEVRGWTISGGYVALMVDRVVYRAHRLAWLYVHGYIPDTVDHINRVRTDNRIANLRESNTAENAQNSAMRANNSSGYFGVVRIEKKSGPRFQAKIVVNRKAIYLGTFMTGEAAAAAYAEAKRRLHVSSPEAIANES